MADAPVPADHSRLLGRLASGVVCGVLLALVWSSLAGEESAEKTASASSADTAALALDTSTPRPSSVPAQIVSASATAILPLAARPTPSSSPLPTTEPTPLILDLRPNVATRLNLRSTPGGTLVMPLFASTHLTRLEQNEVLHGGRKWTLVQTDNAETGWVASDLLTSWNRGDQGRFLQQTLLGLIGVNEAAEHSLAARVDSFLAGYASAVNQRDYRSAHSMRTARLNGPNGSFAEFADSMNTTELSDFVVARASQSGSVVTALVGFVSKQESKLGPDGSTCTLWALEYALEVSGRSFLIAGAVNLEDSPMPCADAGLAEHEPQMVQQQWYSTLPTATPLPSRPTVRPTVPPTVEAVLREVIAADIVRRNLQSRGYAENVRGVSNSELDRMGSDLCRDVKIMQDSESFVLYAVSVADASGSSANDTAAIFGALGGAYCPRELERLGLLGS